MQAHHMILEALHYKWVSIQKQPFKLILINNNHVAGDKLLISEISGVDYELTGYWCEFEILSTLQIPNTNFIPQYVWLTVSPLACHSPQKSNF